MDCSKVCKVGYALNPKKLRKSSVDNTLAAVNPLPDSPVKKVVNEWRGGGLSDILDNIENDTVQFSIWDHEVPVHLQPDFDVIIHKLTEDIDRKESAEKMKALDNYLKLHPNTVIVDPIDSVRKVISRARTCRHLSEVELTMGSKCPFRQPKYVVFENCDDVSSAEDVLLTIAQHGLTFPIICKPVEACGTAVSHHMVVIVSPEDIHLMVRPCVVQQYYNHDANFFKVYVIDQEVMVFQRTSLPNLSIPPETSSSGSTNNGASCKRSLDNNPTDGKNKRLALRSVEFDSRKHYPTIEDFLVCSPASPSTDSADGRAVSNGFDVGSEGVSWKTKRKHTTHSSPVSKIMTRSAVKLIETQPHADDSSTLVPEVIQLPAASEPSHPEDRSHEIIEQHMEEFKAAAVELQREFQLSLFGFDVIIPNSNSEEDKVRGLERNSSDDLLRVSQLELTKECDKSVSPQSQNDVDIPPPNLVVIDVNYFPSYKEVKDFPYRLKNFLKSKSVSTTAS